jgi:hypothetical protein
MDIGLQGRCFMGLSCDLIVLSSPTMVVNGVAGTRARMYKAEWGMRLSRCNALNGQVNALD